MIIIIVFVIVMLSRMQNRLMEQQDEHIQQIHSIAVKLKHDNYELNRQLVRQNVLMQELDEEFVLTNKKLTGVSAKLATLLQTNDMNQICTCGMLCAFMVVMFILIFAI